MENFKTYAEGRDLLLSATLDAPPEAVYRAWTDATLLRQWFAPAPVKTPFAELDVRPGGATHIKMETPDGNLIDLPGVYLDVIPDRKLVMTNLFSQAWVPAENEQFGTLIELEFIPAGGKTEYRATIRHWTAEDRETHESWGFAQGWEKTTQQLENLAQSMTLTGVKL